MTKDEASDLNMLVETLAQRRLEFQLAEWRLKEAQGKYESFVWALQQQKRVEPNTCAT